MNTKKYASEAWISGWDSSGFYPLGDHNTPLKVPHHLVLPLFFQRVLKKTNRMENQKRDQRWEEAPIEIGGGCKRCWDF